MTFNSVTELILDLAVEDFFGLWEFEWRARAIKQARGHSIERATLMAEMSRLLSNGSVGVFRGTHFNGDETQELFEPAALAAIADPANWDPPGADEAHFRIAATPKGEERYRTIHEKG